MVFRYRQDTVDTGMAHMSGLYVHQTLQLRVPESTHLRDTGGVKKSFSVRREFPQRGRHTSCNDVDLQSSKMDRRGHHDQTQQL